MDNLYTNRVIRRDDARDKLNREIHEGVRNVERARVLNQTYSDSRDMRSLLKPSNYGGPADQCGREAYQSANLNPSLQGDRVAQMFNPSYIPAVQGGGSSEHPRPGFRQITEQSSFALDPEWVHNMESAHFQRPLEAPNGKFIMAVDPKNVGNGFYNWMTRRPTAPPRMYKDSEGLSERVMRVLGVTAVKDGLMEGRYSPLLVGLLLVLTLFYILFGGGGEITFLLHARDAKPYIPTHHYNTDLRGDLQLKREPTSLMYQQWLVQHNTLISDRDPLYSPNSKRKKKKPKKPEIEPSIVHTDGTEIDWSNVGVVLYGDDILGRWTKVAPSSLDVLHQYGRYRLQATDISGTGAVRSETSPIVIGDTTNNLLWRMEDYEAPLASAYPDEDTPETIQRRIGVRAVIINIGSNNIAKALANETVIRRKHFDQEIIDGTYVGIDAIVKLSLARFPYAKVFVMPLLPRGKYWPENQYYPPIKAINALLHKHITAQRESRVEVLDCNKRFLDSREFNIRRMMFETEPEPPEPLHLNMNGFTELGKCIRERLNTAIGIRSIDMQGFEGYGNGNGK